MGEAHELWIVVTCMGRLEHVRQTLPEALAHVGARYCLVDYSCPDRTGDWIKSAFPRECGSGRVWIERVPGKALFHKTHALNVGARAAIERGASALCFLDADTLAKPGLGVWLAERLRPGRFIVELFGQSLVGFLALTAADFVAAGGFDEGIREYGGEDIEMRLRLHLARGLAYMAAPEGLLGAVVHGNELRARHYRQKEIERTNLENLNYVKAKVREWTGRDLFEHPPAVVSLYRKPARVEDRPGSEPRGARPTSRAGRRGVGARPSWK